MTKKRLLGVGNCILMYVCNAYSALIIHILVIDL